MASTKTEIQSFLNSLSQVPGSILFRNQIAWEGLPPGDEGQLLTIGDDGNPEWTHRGTYFPALFQYDDASTYLFNGSVPLSNDPWTALFRFATDPFTGLRDIWVNFASGQIFNRGYMGSTGVVTIRQHDDANNLCLQLLTPPGYNDGAIHYGYVHYDPTTPAVEFIIDGQNADDTGHPNRILNAATLPADPSGEFTIGRWPTLSRFWPGLLGAFGYKGGTHPDWQDFMDPTGSPRPVDQVTWLQWLGRPDVWHDCGELAFNKGSAGPFTPNGPIQLADPLSWS